MSEWVDICALGDLPPDAGVCALVRGEQVAVFYLSKLNRLFALGNFDPVGKANVMSRGMVGDLGGEPMVAAPLYKQHYSLVTGVCFEDHSIALPCYAVRVEQGRVLIGGRL